MKKSGCHTSGGTCVIVTNHFNTAEAAAGIYDKNGDCCRATHADATVDCCFTDYIDIIDSLPILG